MRGHDHPCDTVFIFNHAIERGPEYWCKGINHFSVYREAIKNSSNFISGFFHKTKGEKSFAGLFSLPSVIMIL